MLGIRLQRYCRLKSILFSSCPLNEKKRHTLSLLNQHTPAQLQSIVKKFTTRNVTIHTQSIRVTDNTKISQKTIIPITAVSTNQNES